ncbi:hypothetical protein DICVIV_00410 [Dictyocaulus viviparus]|uniref:Uncharacterized protein n=1 Tax=Dictyocaulus viviparus TaxID=29172 RepID=A0A0D8YAS8_DICVI|nr:hypothetical protein DICVIV_00410 [Dictyocaulus viviparus]
MTDEIFVTHCSLCLLSELYKLITKIILLCISNKFDETQKIGNHHHDVSNIFDVIQEKNRLVVTLVEGISLVQIIYEHTEELTQMKNLISAIFVHMQLCFSDGDHGLGSSHSSQTFEPSTSKRVRHTTDISPVREYPEYRNETFSESHLLLMFHGMDAAMSITINLSSTFCTMTDPSFLLQSISAQIRRRRDYAGQKIADTSQEDIPSPNEIEDDVIVDLYPANAFRENELRGFTTFLLVNIVNENLLRITATELMSSL